jgi:hypothetical protein
MHQVSRGGYSNIFKGYYKNISFSRQSEFMHLLSCNSTLGPWGSLAIYNIPILF